MLPVLQENTPIPRHLGQLSTPAKVSGEKGPPGVTGMKEPRTLLVRGGAFRTFMGDVYCAKPVPEFQNFSAKQAFTSAFLMNSVKFTHLCGLSLS